MSRWDRNERSLREFVGQYIRDSANETIVRTWEIKDRGIRYVIFTQIGDPPATERPRYLYDRDAYVLEFTLDGFNVGGYDSSLRGLSLLRASDPRDIRIMQTFVPAGDYIYIFNFNSFKESYQLHLPVVEDILQSVRWR